jgi:hypothetical protein
LSGWKLFVSYAIAHQTSYLATNREYSSNICYRLFSYKFRFFILIFLVIILV